MSCSAHARVPILVALIVIPDDKVPSFFGLQGLALMGLYLLGFVAAIFIGHVDEAHRENQRAQLLNDGDAIYLAHPNGATLALAILERQRHLYSGGKNYSCHLCHFVGACQLRPSDEMEKAHDAVLAQWLNGRTFLRLDGQFGIGVTNWSIRMLASWAKHSRPLSNLWVTIGKSALRWSSFAAREVLWARWLRSTAWGYGRWITISRTPGLKSIPKQAATVYACGSWLSLLVFYVALACNVWGTLAVVYRNKRLEVATRSTYIYMTVVAYVGCVGGVFKWC